MTRRGFHEVDPQARTPQAISILLDFDAYCVDIPCVLLGKTIVLLMPQEYQVSNWVVLHRKSLLDYLKDYFPRATEVKLYVDSNR